MAETLLSRFSLPATPERVFEAWTSPEQVEAWWVSPDEFRTKFTHDLQVGGAWRAEFTSPDGSVSAVYGEYRRLERPSLLSMTYQFSWSPDDPAILAAFAFAPAGGDTDVTLTQTGAITDDLREDPEGGWSVTLAFLRAYLSGA